MKPAQQYWFPAKRYGWGWGVPRAWQGWLVLISYLAVVLVPATLLGGDGGGVVSLAVALVATPLLVWVCFLKGEPPGACR